MNKTCTLLKSVDELEASMWLEIFENLPDETFYSFNTEPSSAVIDTLKQYARCCTVMINKPIILN